MTYYSCESTGAELDPNGLTLEDLMGPVEVPRKQRTAMGRAWKMADGDQRMTILTALALGEALSCGFGRQLGKLKPAVYGGLQANALRFVEPPAVPAETEYVPFVPEQVVEPTAEQFAVMLEKVLESCPEDRVDLLREQLSWRILQEAAERRKLPKPVRRAARKAFMHVLVNRAGEVVRGFMAEVAEGK